MKNLLGVSIAVGLSLCATQAAAQGRYRGPDCELKTGHFLVNSGVVYLKGATEEADPVKRERMLADAERNLLNAIERGQADNPAVWYFLGRYYVLENDPFGVDSAFSRAESLAPECAADIAFYRQTMWVPFVNAGIDSMRGGEYEGAKDEFRRANAVYQDDNIAFFYLASIFGNEGASDSALKYFKQVVEIGDADTARVDNFRTSLANVAILYHMAENWDSAATWYRKVREYDPSDTDALLGLAEASQAQGDTMMTMMLYDSVLAHATDMGAVDLFDTGVKLFGVSQFERAARAFALGLEKNPYHRDALYNLANTYLALAQTEELSEEARSKAAVDLEAVSRRLVQVDPYNGASLRLLAAAHQMQRHDDSTLAALELAEGLEFEVQVDVAQETEGGYSIQGKVTNRLEKETRYPTISFEFLDAEGNVVVVEELAGGAIPMHGRTPFEVLASGDGIVAWRYRVAS